MRFVSLPLCIIILSSKARSTSTLCSSKNCKRLIRRSNSKLKLNTPPPQHTTTLLSATFHIKNNTFNFCYPCTLCLWKLHAEHMEIAHRTYGNSADSLYFHIITFKGKTASTGCFLKLKTLTQKQNLQPFLTCEALLINHCPTALFSFVFFFLSSRINLKNIAIQLCAYPSHSHIHWKFFGNYFNT